jgi:hypothetical protein
MTRYQAIRKREKLAARIGSGKYQQFFNPLWVARRTTGIEKLSGGGAAV